MDTESKACKTIEASLPALLPDLLLDPAAVPVAIQKHIEACDPCRAAIERELAGHRVAIRLLEDWSAPELTPYFESRMAALLREEQRHPRAGVIERVRSWMLLSNLHMKPMAGAAALGLLLAIGGGAYVDLTQSQPAPVPQASATVRDLQSLDDNAQVFQQMNSLDAGESDGGNSL